jgi:hypothetical protein
LSNGPSSFASFIRNTSAGENTFEKILKKIWDKKKNGKQRAEGAEGEEFLAE